MVAILSKALLYLRLHAVLSSIMTLLSLHNAIQCGRSWQPYGRSGSATLPATDGDIKSQITFNAVRFYF
jgi:hypothetical protein